MSWTGLVIIAAAVPLGLRACVGPNPRALIQDAEQHSSLLFPRTKSDAGKATRGGT